MIFNQKVLFLLLINVLWKPEAVNAAGPTGFTQVQKVEQMTESNKKIMLILYCLASRLLVRAVDMDVFHNCTLEKLLTE